MYILKFQPILKPVIWGGDEICRFKQLTSCEGSIGESWEISGVKGNVSVVSNGELAGATLNELLKKYREELVGKSVYDRFGDVFPLLIKFIDARDSLSIQVHPDDKLAKERHGSFGKSEMWYVVNASEEAFLYSGFREEITPEEYVKSLEDDSFTGYLQRFEVKPGDVFYLPAGRVHAIGAGCFIAEIQQTSDITYRIYDYNRKDANGNPRELHTELAKEAIDYKVYPDCKLDYHPGEREVQSLVSCPYFTTNVINGGAGESLYRKQGESFVIYICLEGSGTATDPNGKSTRFRQGETLLVPAEMAGTTLYLKERSKLLETFVE